MRASLVSSEINAEKAYVTGGNHYLWAACKGKYTIIYVPAV